MSSIGLWLILAGVPLLFGLFGLFRWRQRDLARATLKTA